MNASRAPLALQLLRDLLVAALACGVAVLVLLAVQVKVTEHELRYRSLETAARHVEQNLRIDGTGGAALPEPPGSSWASFGYPTLVFDRYGRILLQRPERLDPEVVAALSNERLASLHDDDRKFHTFALTLGDQRIIGAVLRTGPVGAERMIQVFKDENAPDVLSDDMVREFPYRSLQVLVPLFALLMLGGGWIVFRRMRPVAERLERSVATQREFLHRAAHQLRTPLTVISARAETLDDRRVGEQLRGDVRVLARTISQLLQLNEIETLSPGDDRAASLGAVGEAVRDELAAPAALRRVRLDLVLPATPVTVRGDPNVIEVAVRNLVENALDHAPAGSAVALRISADGEVSVSDAGPGIPEASRDKIFEPFWSSDRTGARAGLGLAIVRRVADCYGAAVTLAAPPGGGATVALRFPPHAADGHPRGATTGTSGIPASLASRRRRAALDSAGE